LADEPAAGIDAHAPPEVRANRPADVLSRSPASRVVLCDVFGARGAVLEHDISVEVVKRHKRSSLAELATTTELVRPPRARTR